MTSPTQYNPDAHSNTHSRQPPQQQYPQQYTSSQQAYPPQYWLSSSTTLLPNPTSVPSSPSRLPLLPSPKHQQQMEVAISVFSHLCTNASSMPNTHECNGIVYFLSFRKFTLLQKQHSLFPISQTRSNNTLLNYTPQQQPPWHSSSTKLPQQTTNKSLLYNQLRHSISQHCRNSNGLETVRYAARKKRSLARLFPLHSCRRPTSYTPTSLSKLSNYKKKPALHTASKHKLIMTFIFDN